MSVFKKDVEFLAICLMCWSEGICHGESQSETEPRKSRGLSWRWQTLRFGDFLGLCRGSRLVGIGPVSPECRISEIGIIVSGTRELPTSGAARFYFRCRLGARTSIRMECV